MRKLINASIQVLLLFNCLNSQPKVYWTDVSEGTISRADFDGTNVEIILSNAGIPLGITFDIVSSKMYWTNYTAGTIQRANLDGSNLEILATELGSPTGLALDLINNKIYWTNDQPNIIQRSNLDGSDIETLFSQYLDPVEVALDVDNNRMYWSNWNPYIYSATLDGLDMDTTVFVGSSYILGFALDIINRKVYWTNSDDIPGDGLIMGANLDGTDVDTLVTNLQFPFGIAVVTSSVGIEENISTLANSFTLNQNYPNPFNAITTIDYTLSSTNTVELTIHNLLGQEIKTLVYSRQSLGNHQVQWDGRNNVGDLIPSGVYFYRIRVGSYTETRKMILLE